MACPHNCLEERARRVNKQRALADRKGWLSPNSDQTGFVLAVGAKCHRKE
jgi:hypothetical protein